MQLCVARILPNQKLGLPLINSANMNPPRRPRPDDPTPRKPPAIVSGMARVGVGLKRTMSMTAKAHSGEDVFGASKKRQKENDGQGGDIQELSENTRLSQRTSSFKIPSIPPSKSNCEGTKEIISNGISHQLEVDNKAVSTCQTLTCSKTDE